MADREQERARITLTYDNKGDQPATRAALEKLIYQDKVNYILDNFLANETLNRRCSAASRSYAWERVLTPTEVRPEVQYYWRADGSTSPGLFTIPCTTITTTRGRG